MTGVDEDPVFDIIQEKYLDAIQDEDLDLDLNIEDIPEIIDRVLIEIGRVIYEEVLENDEGLRHLYETKAEFERGIDQRWGEPLELLERFIAWSREVGGTINTESRFAAATDQDFHFEALTQLHARASQVAMEIHHLLKGGFADGAFARWRSLHELSITTSFIHQTGEDTAERFLHYRYLWEYYFARTLQEHEDALDSEKIESEVVDSLEEGKQELVDRFGSDFDDNGFGTGWASEAYEGGGGPSIRELQDTVDLDHLQPYYRLASESVHGGSKGTLDRLGLIDISEVEQPEVLLAGPSNAGLSIPGQLTAISLAQITFALIEYQANSTYIVEMKGMQLLLDDINESFEEVAEELKEDEQEAMEEWADQDIVDIAVNYIGPPALLTESFFEDYTEFDSTDGFEDAMPIYINEIQDLETLPEEAEIVVRHNSEFSSMEELIEAAFENWVFQNVDVSEFE